MKQIIMSQSKTTRKPNNYWTLERCIADAKKYKTRSQWVKQSSGATSAAQTNGWLDQCCKHMEEIKKPNGYWTLQRCKSDAKKYKTQAEWRKASPGHNAAYTNGWLDQCCKHMKELKKPNNYWTLERCIADAKKYKTRTQWQKQSPGAIQAARRDGWLDQCSNHMMQLQKPNGYWSLERCIADAKKYKTRTQWQQSSGGSYSRALDNGWVGVCCSHMKELLYFGPRTIREFLFAHDIEHIVEHKFRHSSVVRKYSFDFYLPAFNLVIEYHGDQHKEGSSGFFKTPEENKAALERDKIKKDWCKSKRICYVAILNWEIKKPADIEMAIVRKLKTISKLRSIPLRLTKRLLTKKEQALCEAKTKWTKQACIADAKKYKTKFDWRKASPGHDAAYRYGWLDQCCKHMKELRKPNNYWTLERCIADAKKYKTRREWQKMSGGAYNVALRNGCLDQCCAHMKEIQKPRGYWTLERCIADAKKYKTQAEWRKASTGHNAAYTNGWLDQCCKHMKELKKPNNYWTLERCIADAKKYKTRREWQKMSGGAYNVALRNGCLDQCCKHMKEINKPNGYWSLERCIADAKKYKARGEWAKNSDSPYRKALKNGWLDQCCKHMKEINKPNGYWTLERCIADAKKYKTKFDWRKASPSAKTIAQRNSWLDQCCKHMPKGKKKAK